MSERYIRLIALPENLYAEGSPVLIAAGALLKDKQTGKVLVQLKLRNLDEKRIQEAVVQVRPLDMAGAPVGEPVEHRYQQLRVARDQEFAQKEPVVLPGDAAKRVAVSVSHVTFEDGSSWSNEAAVWAPIAGAEVLEDGLRNAVQVEEYRLAYGADCAYMPRKEHDLWYCTCGAVNRQGEEKCHKCGRAWATLLAVEPAALMAQRFARQVQAENAAVMAQVEAQAAKQKKKSKALIVLAAVLICAAVVGVIAAKPARVMKEARGLAEVGDYMAALALLEELDKPEKTAADWQEYMESMEDEIQDAIDDEDYPAALALISKYTRLDTAEENIAYIQRHCEHQLEDTELKENTCTGDGYDRKTCTVCGYIEETIFEAPGHEFTSEVTKESTCTEHGTEVFTCTVCNEVEKKELDLLPHTYRSSVTKQPTCTETGIRANVCSVCGDEIEEDIPMVPHTNKENVLKAATCTEKGVMQTKCTVCGREEGQVAIPALGHNYVQSVQTAVTCTADGVDLYTCTQCNDQYTKPVKSNGHGWNSATCTAPKTCSICKQTEGNALGHNWYRDLSDISCKRCGQKWRTTISLKTNLPYRYDDTSGTIQITEIVPTYDPILPVNTYGEPKISVKLAIKGKAYPNNEENPYMKCSGSFYADLYDSNGKKIGSDSFFLIGEDGNFSENVYFSINNVYLKNNGTYSVKIREYD